jgi:hypothetical protein
VYESKTHPLHLLLHPPQEKFEEMFSVYGKITSRKVMVAKDDESGDDKSKGFGFVAFETNDAAVAAVEALNGKEMDGTKLYVGRAQKKAERMTSLRRAYEQRRQENQARYKGVNLYVKNLDDAITDEEIRVKFAEFGQITSAKVREFPVVRLAWFLSIASLTCLVGVSSTVCVSSRDQLGKHAGYARREGNITRVRLCVLLIARRGHQGGD